MAAKALCDLQVKIVHVFDVFRQRAHNRVHKRLAIELTQLVNTLSHLTIRKLIRLAEVLVVIPTPL